MALIIALVNKSELAPVSDYRADVYINERHIAGPFKVEGHERKDGWEALVKQFAAQLDCKEFEPAIRYNNINLKGKNNE